MSGHTLRIRNWHRLERRTGWNIQRFLLVGGMHLTSTSVFALVAISILLKFWLCRSLDGICPLTPCPNKWPCLLISGSWDQPTNEDLYITSFNISIPIWSSTRNYVLTARGLCNLCVRPFWGIGRYVGSPFLLLHCLQIHCRDDLDGILRGITHSITHYQFIWSIYKLKRFLGLIGLLWPPVHSISYLGRGSEPDNGGWGNLGAEKQAASTIRLF